MLKILIIEDDDGIRMLLKNLLKRRFICAVLEAVNGKIALQVLQENIPDLILLDIAMPVMDGVETLYKIREQNIFKNTPVIMITAYGDKEIVATLADKGISDYILKPIDNDQTVKRIQKVFSKINEKGGKKQQSIYSNEVPKLLIVDRDQSFSNFLNSNLGERFTILEASSGTDGLNLFRLHRPEYILVSDHMGLLDKKILTQKIREVADGDTVGIFLIVENVSSLSTKAFIYDGILKKTFNSDLFLKEFDKVVLAITDPLEKLKQKLILKSSAISNLVTQVFKKSADQKISLIDESAIFFSNELFCASAKMIESAESINIDFKLCGTEKDIVSFTNKIAEKQNKKNFAANDLFKDMTQLLLEKIIATLDQSGLKLSFIPEIMIEQHNDLPVNGNSYRLPVRTESNETFVTIFSFEKSNSK